jgi:hypothetical protein
MNRLTRQICVEASTWMGIEEVGENDGPEVRTWLARVYRKPGNPWCAAFAWCMLDDACAALGLVNPFPPTAGVHLLVARAKVAGAWTNESGAGHIFAIDHTQPGGHRLGHCGIVVEVPDDKNILTIEGNGNEAGSREGRFVLSKLRPQDSITLGYLDPSLLFDERIHP